MYMRTKGAVADQLNGHSVLYGTSKVQFSTSLQHGRSVSYSILASLVDSRKVVSVVKGAN